MIVDGADLTKNEKPKSVFVSIPKPIFFMAIALMLMRCAESFFVPIFPLYVKVIDASVPLFIIGLVTSINRLGIVFMTPVSGTWCDRLGYGKPYMVGVFLTSGTCILGGISSGAVDLGLYRLLSGMGYGMVTIATMAFANQLTTLENRATAMSLLSASMLAGAAIGPLPGGYIAQSFDTLVSGYRATFFIGGFLELLVGISAFFLIARQGKKETSRVRQSAPKFSLIDLLKNRAVSVTASASFLFGIGHGAFLYFTIPLLGDRLGFRPFEIGWVMSAFGAGHVLGSLFLGRMSDHLQKRRPFVFLGFFGPGVVILFFSFLNSIPIMIISTFFLGVVTSPCCGVIPAFIAESAPERPAAAMGMAKSVEQLGLFVGPMIGGVLIPAFGFPSAMVFYAAVTIAGSLIFIVGLSEPKWLKVESYH